MKTMTLQRESTPSSSPCLLLAFELGERRWKVGFTVGIGQRPRVCDLAAGAVARLDDEIRRAKQRFGVPSDAPVISCYEAGRDGFWLHRYLVAHGITNHVIDSSSIEVSRRARRAKTDRLDLGGLLTLLARFVQGERRLWHVVRVPSVTEEDARHLPRTIEAVTQHRTRLINRVKGLLATHGVRCRVDADFLRTIREVRLWDGTPLPAGLTERLQCEWAQLEHLSQQLRALKAIRTRRQRDLTTTHGRTMTQLLRVRGVGPTSATVLTAEIFGWRQIRNRRQLGALVGLVPAPYQSGEMHRDQGITRAGNTHARHVIMQVAWGWVRHQPHSALTQWYQHRFGGGGKRVQRVGIVALARKLLIALWRYLERGVIPDGAQLKPLRLSA